MASSAKIIANFNMHHEDEHNRYNVYVYACRPLCESVYKSFGHVQNKVCNSYMSTINYLHCSLSEFWIDFHGYLSDIIDCRFYSQFREFMVVDCHFWTLWLAMIGSYCEKISIASAVLSSVLDSIVKGNKTKAWRWR